MDDSLNKVLRSAHAPLVFEDRKGKLRDLTVRTLPDHQKRKPRFCERDDTVEWDEFVAVTADASILDYLTAATVPRLPVAGDRPWYVLNPSKVLVAVVNAGGPAPGLNTVSDSITKRYFGLCEGDATATTRVFGFVRGFWGLANEKWKWLVPSKTMIGTFGHDQEYIVTDDHALDPATFLQSSRFDISGSENQKNLETVVEVLHKLNIDILHVCGGDGSLKGAQAISELYQKRYRKDGRELVVVCGPKTMDRDLQLADYSFGYLTTVEHTVRAIHTFHTTVETLNRVGVMQVFGAASGFVALQASYSSGVVDYVIIPEEVERTGLEFLCSPARYKECVEEARFHGLAKAIEKDGFSVEDVYRAGLKLVFEHAWEEVRKRVKRKGHALVVVAEGAKGVFKQSGKGREVMSFAEMEKFFKDRLAAPDEDAELRETAVTSMEPKYLIRDHRPQAFDVDLCKITGKAMADAALAGYTDCAVTRWNHQYVLAPLSVVTHLTNRVDPRDYAYRTMIAKYHYNQQPRPDAPGGNKE